MKAFALWLSASALAFACCGTAAAQDDQDQAPAASDNEELVVTATRRAENLMTSPIAASVLSGNDLENKGVTDVDALQFAMPSLVVNNFGQGNDFNVRGIGKAEHNTQTTTGVITYRDGVPTFPGYVQKEPYYDIANIQVLRGPQGTIVGQNATGGAVFVNTNDPVIGSTHGYVQAHAGNYDDFGAQGAVNLPLGETVAARISAYGQRRDGFYNITGPAAADANNDLRMYAGRLSLLWKPSDQVTFLSKTDVAYMDFGGYPASPFDKPGDLFDVSYNSPQSARDKFVRSVFRVEYVTEGGVKFRSVSSYQKANTNYFTDLDGVAVATTRITNPYQTFFDDVSERQVTQEFNVISPDSQRFTWLLGGFAVWNKYYFKEPYQFVIDLYGALPAFANAPASTYKLQGTNPTRSLAAFGQLGFQITPDLKLEAGGRYTDSRTTNHVDVLQYGLPLLAEQTATSDNFSYKVSLGWRATPSQYLYAFVATGFRPGGLNVPVGLGLPAPFEPEEVTSYEAGWKANWADGHIRTTVTGFYNDYKNFQVIIGYPAFPTFGIELNVKDPTKIYGFEASAELHFGGFSLDAGINVLHSSLGEFYATDPRGGGATTPCNPDTGPAGPTCIALEGREQTYAPDMTFNMGAQYAFELGNSDKLTVRANYGHIADQWATLFENPARGDRIKARNIVNAQLAWQHDSWTVTGYVTNLTDQHYPAALNSGLYFAGPPRQYGIRVMKVF